MKTLSVKAAGQSLVPDFAAMDAGVLRFVGRSHDSSVGVAGGWVPNEEPSTVPFRAEYVQEVKAGCLTVCDEESARLCGVPFEAPMASKSKPKAE